MKRKILIVDDETDQEDLLKLTFGYKEFMKNYEFIFAPEGITALEILKHNDDVDIALIDINMPNMDGLTLLSYLRELYPQVIAVIISAYSDLSNIRIAMNKGAFDFVTKPIDMPDLEMTLKKTIQQAEISRANMEMAKENKLLYEMSLELEMKVLRAQINPHFIFNSLNSINYFVRINDKENASDYLIKFSRLIRMILENSSASYISLSTELEGLQLYIELELLRFSQKFDYEIIIQEDLDIHSIKVPPLIIQPFVENAIKHGLMPLKKMGKLTIIVSQENETIHIVVEDNGIGRSKAATQIRDLGNHHSMGIAITKDRIMMKNGKKANDQHSSVEIFDLFADSDAAGTKVVIQLPLVI